MYVMCTCESRPQRKGGHRNARRSSPLGESGRPLLAASLSPVLGMWSTRSLTTRQLGGISEAAAPVLLPSRSVVRGLGTTRKSPPPARCLTPGTLASSGLWGLRSDSCSQGSEGAGTGRPAPCRRQGCCRSAVSPGQRGPRRETKPSVPEAALVGDAFISFLGVELKTCWLASLGERRKQ